jgi:hypothetical protein
MKGSGMHWTPKITTQLQYTVRDTVSKIALCTLGAACCAGFLDAAPSMLPDTDDELVAESVTPPPPMEVDIPKFILDLDDQIAQTLARFGASAEQSHVDMALSFEMEEGNPNFVIEEGQHLGTVYGVPAFIDVLGVQDGRPFLEQAASMPVFRRHADVLEEALASDMQLTIVDILAVSQVNGEMFSSRVLHWTPPQQERVLCMALPASNDKMCGLSMPHDFITPEEWRYTYPEPNPLLPPSQSFYEFSLTIRNPERLAHQLLEMSERFPEICVNCPNGLGAICASEFYKWGSALHLAKAELDACLERAETAFVLASFATVVVAKVVLAYCFNCRFDEETKVIVCPGGIRIPKTWQVAAGCLAAVGVTGYVYWQFYEHFMAERALCHAKFARAVREELDRRCAAAQP